MTTRVLDVTHLIIKEFEKYSDYKFAVAMFRNGRVRIFPYNNIDYDCNAGVELEAVKMDIKDAVELVTTCLAASKLDFISVRMMRSDGVKIKDISDLDTPGIEVDVVVRIQE